MSSEEGGYSGGGTTANNKIVYNGNTLIDLTSDTAVESDVALGKTFHKANGMLATGTNSGGGGGSEPLIVEYDDEDIGEAVVQAMQSHRQIIMFDPDFDGYVLLTAYADYWEDYNECYFQFVITNENSSGERWLYVYLDDEDYVAEWSDSNYSFLMDGGSANTLNIGNKLTFDANSKLKFYASSVNYIYVFQDRSLGNYNIRLGNGNDSSSIYSDVRLNGIATPTSNNDAVNKQYVDNMVGNIETLLSAI